MSKWILPGVLDVEMTNALSDEILALFSKISTGIIVDRVNDYVSRNIESANEQDRKAAIKLQRIYADINRVEAYLQGDEAKEFAETLANLQYSDVNCTVDINTLKKYREMIIDLLAEDEEFRNTYTGEIRESETRGMKTAYTNKLDKDNLEAVLEQMYVLSEGCIYRMYVVQLRKNIEDYKHLFKNSPHHVNKSTIIRKAIFKKDKLRNILRGLDYIIPKIEAGKSAYSWRRL